MRVRALFVYPEPTRGTHRGTSSTNPRRTTESCLTNRFGTVFSARQLSHDDEPTARSTPARGNAPGTCPSACCALQGRSDRFRNPGRCPGLECGGTFSAAINVVQIRMHEPGWLATYEMASILSGEACLRRLQRQRLGRRGERQAFPPVLREPVCRWRSEEHTSELQSHLKLVCRLLLEKKN